VTLNSGVKGLSETRNVGIRASSGDTVAFIDDAAVADEHWLESLARAFQQAEVAAVGGRAVPLWLEGKAPAWLPEELHWVIGCTYRGLPTAAGRVRNVIGCNMAFRTGVFNRAGLFRSQLGRTGKTKGVGEEADMCLRIAHTLPDSLILYEPAAVVRHKVPGWRLTAGYVCRRSYDEGFYKVIVQRLARGPSSKALSTENRYLRYLLFTSVPQKLLSFYRGSPLVQAGVIIMSMLCTGIGYVTGSLTARVRAESESPAETAAQPGSPAR
jgi:hypothetical protein